MSALTLNILITFFLILKQMPPNLATFPKIYLATIWCDMSWPNQNFSVVFFDNFHIF